MFVFPYLLTCCSRIAAYRVLLSSSTIFLPVAFACHPQSFYFLTARLPFFFLPIELFAICGLSVVSTTDCLLSRYPRLSTLLPIVFLPFTYCISVFLPVVSSTNRLSQVVGLSPCFVAFDSANIQPPHRCAMPLPPFFALLQPVFDLNQYLWAHTVPVSAEVIPWRSVSIQQKWATEYMELTQCQNGTFGNDVLDIPY